MVLDIDDIPEFVPSLHSHQLMLDIGTISEFLPSPIHSGTPVHACIKDEVVDLKGQLHTDQEDETSNHSTIAIVGALQPPKIELGNDVSLPDMHPLVRHPDTQELSVLLHQEDSAQTLFQDVQRSILVGTPFVTVDAVSFDRCGEQRTNFKIGLNSIKEEDESEESPWKALLDDTTLTLINEPKNGDNESTGGKLQLAKSLELSETNFKFVNDQHSNVERTSLYTILEEDEIEQSVTSEEIAVSLFSDEIPIQISNVNQSIRIIASKSQALGKDSLALVNSYHASVIKTSLPCLSLVVEEDEGQEPLSCVFSDATHTDSVEGPKVEGDQSDGINEIVAASQESTEPSLALVVSGLAVAITRSCLKIYWRPQGSFRHNNRL